MSSDAAAASPRAGRLMPCESLVRREGLGDWIAESIFGPVSQFREGRTRGVADDLESLRDVFLRSTGV